MVIRHTVLAKIPFLRWVQSNQYFDLIFIVILGIMMTSCASNSSDKTIRKTLSKPNSVRVGTYNVFTGAKNTDEIVNVIRGMDADILLLQELSITGSKSLDVKLKHYYSYRHFSKGVAILSRYPLRNPRYEQSKHGINGYLVAEVKSPAGRFQVASLHLDPLHLWTTSEKWSLPYQFLWGQDAVHRKEVEQIVHSLHPAMPTILGGDFNSVSGVPIHQLQEQGYTDSFADVNKHPDKTPTLHFKLFGFRTGRRIDYILHDSSFQTIESHVFSGSPSDHNPVVSILGWR
jgi:endonuclease/exonuclease/phosphatase family metal-dependent hydrolase